jgi:hypothetical protein
MSFFSSLFGDIGNAVSGVENAGQSFFSSFGSALRGQQQQNQQPSFFSSAGQNIGGAIHGGISAVENAPVPFTGSNNSPDVTIEQVAKQLPAAAEQTGANVVRSSANVIPDTVSGLGKLGSYALPVGGDQVRQTLDATDSAVKAKVSTLLDNVGLPKADTSIPGQIASAVPNVLATLAPGGIAGKVGTVVEGLATAGFGVKSLDALNAVADLNPALGKTILSTVLNPGDTSLAAKIAPGAAKAVAEGTTFAAGNNVVQGKDQSSLPQDAAINSLLIGGAQVGAPIAKDAAAKVSDFLQQAAKDGVPAQTLDNMKTALANEHGAIPLGPSGDASKAPRQPLTTLYHGTSADVSLENLDTGSTTGRGQQRGLIYASDNPDLASKYASARSEAVGQSPKTIPFNFGGKILDQNSPTYAKDLGGLINNPDFKNLSGKTRNQLTNIFPDGKPYGALSGDVLDTNPELQKYLVDHGFDAVKFHHTPFGGSMPTNESNQTAILNPSKILRAKPQTKAEVQQANIERRQATPLPAGKPAPIVPEPAPGTPESFLQALGASPQDVAEIQGRNEVGAYKIPTSNTPAGLTAESAGQSLTRSTAADAAIAHGDVNPDTLQRGTPEAKAQAGLPAPAQVKEGPTPLGGHEVTPGKALTKTAALPEMSNLTGKNRSESSKVFGQRIADYTQSSSDMKAPALTKFEDAIKGMSRSDRELASQVLQGKATTADARVQNLADTMRSISGDIATKAKAVDMQVRRSDGTFHPFEARGNFFPHYPTKDVLKAAQGNAGALTRAATKMVADGQFKSLYAAKIFLKKALDSREVTPFGHLESARSSFSSPYVTDSKIFGKYIGQAYDRISLSNQFGAKNGDAEKLMTQMLASGDKFGAETAKKYFNRIAGLESTSLSKQGVSGIAKGYRTVATVTKLPLIGLKHLDQIPRIAAQTGPVNTLINSPRAIRTLITGKASPLVRNATEAVHEAVAHYDPNDPGNKVSSTFLKAVGFNRIITSMRDLGGNAAKSQLDQWVRRLAKNPEDAKAARYLGRAGLDPAAIAARGGATTAEQNKYINSALNKSSLYFRSGDLPAPWNGPAGKLMTMFRSFTYNDMVKGIPPLLSEAKAGNVAPLLIFLAGGTAVGTGVVAATDTIKGKPIPSGVKLLAAGAAQGASPGLVGSVLSQAIEYPHFIPSQAVGLAGGPLASDVYNLAQGASSAATGSASGVKAAEKTVVGQVPFIGPVAANRLLPPSTKGPSGSGSTSKSSTGKTASTSAPKLKLSSSRGSKAKGGSRGRRVGSGRVRSGRSVKVVSIKRRSPSHV